MSILAPSQVDGVLQLDSVEKDLVHEHCTVDTRDHEDHTFCGIMFNVRCKTDLPAEYIEIESISVRGDLGPMTAWVTKEISPNATYEYRQHEETQWTKIYEGVHSQSRRTYTELKLLSSIRIKPGESCGVYVHSALPGDEGIVYDNQRNATTYEDDVFQILPGMAHLSCHPFGSRGYWGSPWRRNREFVGKMGYGIRWKMWSPDNHLQFPRNFQSVVKTMIMASRRVYAHL